MVDYPTYMQVVHERFLVNTADGSGTGTGGVYGAVTTALSANPFTSLSAYIPDTDITTMTTAVGTFSTSITAINAHTDFDTYHDAAVAQIDAKILPDAYIAARVYAHATALDTEINTKILPRFNAGMRDINAVQSSAFTIGSAIIEIDRMDKVDKFAADMRMQADEKRGTLIQNAASEMIRLYLQKKEFDRVLAALTLDLYRLKVAMKGDQATEDKSIDADGARWNLEVYKYAGNLIASVGGGVTSSVPVDGNKTARVISSGLSGAVAGAMVGNTISEGGGGAGYGAIIGGLAGLLSG